MLVTISEPVTCKFHKRPANSIIRGSWISALPSANTYPSLVSLRERRILIGALQRSEVSMLPRITPRAPWETQPHSWAHGLVLSQDNLSYINDLTRVFGVDCVL